MIKPISGRIKPASLLFFLAIFSCQSPSQTQALPMNDLSIIPKPVSTKILNAKLDLKSIKGISLKNNSDEERHVAELFQDYLKPVSLVSISKSLSESNVVQMDRDPKLFRMSAPMFRHEIHKYRVKLDMEDWRFHDLRHEATSRLFEHGFNVMEVALVTGHQDLRMLKRYTHLRAEDLVGRLG